MPKDVLKFSDFAKLRAGEKNSDESILLLQDILGPHSVISLLSNRKKFTKAEKICNLEAQKQMFKNQLAFIILCTL